MDKLRAAARDLAERAARSRPLARLRAAFHPQSGTGETQRGQGLAEYALILSGIAVLAIASLLFLGGTINDLFMAPINEEFAEVLEMLGL